MNGTENISTWSRIRQLGATLATVAAGTYAAIYDTMSWPLVALLLGSLWAYTAKSVLQQIAAAAAAYYQGRQR
jgi:hypothetical protein